MKKIVPFFLSVHLFLLVKLNTQPGMGITYKETYTVAAVFSTIGYTTAFTTQDDTVTRTIAFATPFIFGGNTYSSFYISSNGWVGLANLPAGSLPPLGVGAAASLPDNSASGLSNHGTGGPVIAPFWDDIISTSTVQYKVA